MHIKDLEHRFKSRNSSHGNRDQLASIIQAEVKEIEPQLVVAGMEPLEFTNLFPTWTTRPDVTAIQEKVSAVRYSTTWFISVHGSYAQASSYMFYAFYISLAYPDHCL